jgi:hypothetical protein
LVDRNPLVRLVWLLDELNSTLDLKSTNKQAVTTSIRTPGFMIRPRRGGQIIK